MAIPRGVMVSSLMTLSHGKLASRVLHGVNV